jgi:predicted nucleic acid-binding protein
VSVCVLDVSIAVTWFFEDEATPESWKLLDRIGEFGASVPALWLYEIANVLLMAERRGRTTQARVAEAVGQLQLLPIRVEEAASELILREVLASARTAGLTVYDAAYLELALRLGLPLATKDASLMTAARNAGVVLLP